MKAAEIVQQPMHPHLRLISGTLPSDPSYGRGSAKALGRGLYSVPLLRLTFQYGPIAPAPHAQAAAEDHRAGRRPV